MSNLKKLFANKNERQYTPKPKYKEKINTTALTNEAKLLAWTVIIDADTHEVFKELNTQTAFVDRTSHEVFIYQGFDKFIAACSSETGRLSRPDIAYHYYLAFGSYPTHPDYNITTATSNEEFIAWVWRAFINNSKPLIRRGQMELFESREHKDIARKRGKASVFRIVNLEELEEIDIDDLTNALLKGANQMQVIAEALLSQEKRVFSDIEMRLLIQGLKDDLNTTTDPWNIFSFYRRDFIRIGLLEVE